MTYNLDTRYDSRKSFYGKAQVTDETDFGANIKRLYSYGTHVATIKHNKVAEVYGLYSDTTTRHIKEFLKQNGFKADSSKQIMADYGKEA